MTLATETLLAALALFGMAGFHAALAMGVPWAAYAWGGQAEAGPLPPRLQLGSTVLSPFIAAMAVLMLIRGGWLYAPLAPTMQWPVWAVFLFVLTQFFGAMRSQSLKERRRMAPLYGVTAALCAVVAFAGPIGG